MALLLIAFLCEIFIRVSKGWMDGGEGRHTDLYERPDGEEASATETYTQNKYKE